MKTNLTALAIAVVIASPSLAGADEKKSPPSLAGKSSTSSAKSNDSKEKKGTPPGLAKKSELPPGLAKKVGSKRPANVYVAFDPKRSDRAWFLIDGKWKLEDGFDVTLRGEVKASLALPTVKPPVPLPKVDAKLQVVKFD